MKVNIVGDVTVACSLRKNERIGKASDGIVGNQGCAITFSAACVLAAECPNMSDVDEMTACSKASKVGARDVRRPHKTRHHKAATVIRHSGYEGWML